MPLQINVTGDDTRPRYRRAKGSAANPPEPWRCQCPFCPGPEYCMNVECTGECRALNPRYLAKCPSCKMRRP